jgi:FixJ family two-component response regulator
MDTPIGIEVEANDDEARIEALTRILQAEGFTTRTWASALEFLEAHEAEMTGYAAAQVRVSSS